MSERYETVYLRIGDREDVDHIRIDGVPSSVVEALHHLAGAVQWAIFEVSDEPHPYSGEAHRLHWSDMTKEAE